MCRSSNEPGGPRRCPAHARAKLAAAIAEVDDLERREIKLYRQASKYAADLIAPAARASSCFAAPTRHVDQLREMASEGELDVTDYRDAYRDMLVARRSRHSTRTNQRAALDEVDVRRSQAQISLEKAGLPPAEAAQHLDTIDRETGFAPPF